MMLHAGIRRVATGLALAVLTLALFPGLVLGHAELETATPEDGSTVTEPVTEVSGIYSEVMRPDSSLVVKNSSGDTVARGTVDPEDDTRMFATPATPLANGRYRVESTAVATDGHVEHAIWRFTVAVAPTPSPTPVVTAAPSASGPAQSVPPTPAPATSVPSAAATPIPSAGGSTTGSGGDVVLPIIVALIVLGAGAAYLLTRRTRPTDQA